MHCITLLSFSSPPHPPRNPHIYRLLCVCVWGGVLQGRVQRTVIIRSLEHKAEVTHEGNEEPRLQCCPEGGKGGLGNKLRLRRQR